MIRILIPFFVGFISSTLIYLGEVRRISFFARKYYERYRLTHIWLLRKEEGFKISDELLGRGIKRVAIYGMEDLGHHLVSELQGSDVVIAYLVDRKKNIHTRGYQLFSPEDQLESVDAMVVTAVLSYEEIRKNLQEKLDTEYISLEELL